MLNTIFNTNRCVGTSDLIKNPLIPLEITFLKRLPAIATHHQLMVHACPRTTVALIALRIIDTLSLVFELYQHAL
jgi:hypothetical protein